MAITRDLPIPPDSPVKEGAVAIREIVAAREQLNRIPRRIIEQWQNVPSAEIVSELRRHTGTLQDKIHLAFFHADRLALDSLATSEPHLLREALRSLYTAALLISRPRHRSSAVRLAAVHMAQYVSKNISIPKPFRKEIEDRLDELEEKDLTPDWKRIFAPPLAEARFIELVRLAKRGANSQPPISLPPPGREEDISAADLLAEAAAQQSATSLESSVLSYDLSDRSVRLAGVRLRGFRGCPGEIELTFARQGSPTSTIIFGENGTGKSTIVDAIEFATQGRIGRSSNFDSPLAPALSSLARETSPSVEVLLTDGTIIQRSASIAPTGRMTVSTANVRPGFRLAPITIKRPDILRFLDTDALERGAVLLDYFPADVQNLAARPEEQAHRLRTEMTELRIKRSALSSRLAPLIGVDPGELAAKDRFQTIIRDQIMEGMSRDEFEHNNGWERISEDVRALIRHLADTHTKLGVCKSRLTQMSQVLNPVVHKSQIRILQGIVADVGKELSSAFTQIGSDHPVTGVEVVFGASGPLSLDLVVHLENGKNCFPHQLFSEAYRDLMALLFFTSVAKKASQRGQVQILIMDDVLQSIDANIRHAFVDYVLREFLDWQLIFTVHDRFWRDRLRDLFNAHMHPFIEHDIRRWSFIDGPQFAAPDSDSMTRDLRTLLLSHAEPNTIGVLAGQILEEICGQLTWRMHLKVTRNQYDRYTLGDLWPPVRDRLQGTSAADVVLRIATNRSLRNLTSHANPVSLGLSSAEAAGFANSVLSLYESVRCSICRSWVRGSVYACCSCEAIRL